MPEWLTAASNDAPATPAEIAIRLIVAVVLGGFVAAIYRQTHGRSRVDAHTLTTTLVLLTVLIAMVSMVIGNSVARAFSLVGALAIVRFRTVVEDTRDTAFVIFAVIVGMAVGSGLLLLPALGIPIVGAAALLLSRLQEPPMEAGERCTVVVRLALGREAQGSLGEPMARVLRASRLVATATAKQGAAMDLTYVGALRDGVSAAQVATEINRVEGVQSVDVRVGSALRD